MSQNVALERLVVVGAGTMGCGIAHVAAVAGIPTVLVELTDHLLASSLARIEHTAR